MNREERIHRFIHVVRVKNPNLGEAELRRMAEAAADKVQASKPPAPPPKETGGRSGPAGRAGGKPDTAPPPASTAAPWTDIESPYRFVPLNDSVTASPAAHMRHDRPDPEGFTGDIVVRWTAETPFLIGVEDGTTRQNTVRPFTLGGRYAIPGATLKGALRSVMAAASFSRLGRFNHFLRFGWRDFNDQDHYRRYLLQDDAVRAGWMRHKEDGSAVIEECRWYKTSLTELARRCGVGDDRRWRSKMDLEKKYTALAQSNLMGDVAFNVQEDRADLHPSGARTGRVVVSNVAPQGRRGFEKSVEFVFEAEALRTVDVSAASIKMFDQLNSTPRGKKPEPNGGWKYWRESFFDGKAIPVFFVETEAAKDAPDSIFIGLTRLFRIPQLHTPGDVVRIRHEKHVKAQGDAPDFVEGLFGWVDEPENMLAAPRDDLPKGRNSKVDPTSVARRARIAFDIAFCDQDKAQVKCLNAVNKVLLAPRPSFFPYYLEGGTKGYMHPTPPRLAGRKRYPVGVAEADRLTGRDAGGGADNGNENITSTLQPLSPDTKAGPLTFTGRIRLHNVRLEEVGALLWCLSFGEPRGPYRHSIGRGRPLGFGQMKAEVVAVSLEANAQAGRMVEEGDAIAAFKTFMEKAAPGWENSRSIRGLRAYADPDAGRRNARSLRYPGDFAAYKDVKDKHTSGSKPVVCR